MTSWHSGGRRTFHSHVDGGGVYLCLTGPDLWACPLSTSPLTAAQSDICVEGGRRPILGGGAGRSLLVGVETVLAGEKFSLHTLTSCVVKASSSLFLEKVTVTDLRQWPVKGLKTV